MKIKSNLLLATVIIFGFFLLASTVMAGWNNQNDGNGQSYENGTGKANGKDGCIAWGGMKAADLGPEFEAFFGYRYVWGGGCCASNQMVDEVETNDGIIQIYMPNQCCNPPDFDPFGNPTGNHFPGNHCECFLIRGFAPVS
jgi:hypothetical protein